jgi:hypothetical protein
MNNHVNGYIRLNNIYKLLNRKLHRNAQLLTNQHNLFTVSMVEILLKVGHRRKAQIRPVCESSVVCSAAVLLFIIFS